MQRPRTLKRICDEELLLSYARLDADFGTHNFARNDDFEAAVFLAACSSAVVSKGLAHPVANGRDSLFLIFKTLGDGSPYRVDCATTPQDARERVEAFARFWPSIYITCNEITREPLFIDATGEMKN